MDWTAIALFIAFIIYLFFHDRKDERVATERQNNCHEFHREQREETAKVFEAVASALNKYTEAIAEQASRHKIQNDLHIALIENEELKAQIKELQAQHAKSH